MSFARPTARAIRQIAAKRTLTTAAQRAATFTPAVAVAAARRAPVLIAQRGVKTIDFAGTPEKIWERSDWPVEKLQEYFKDDTLCMLGYGSQGRGQALNARDQGLNVIIGVREGGASWKEAQEDGFVAGESLFPIKEAINKGTIIMNLLSDASQAETWPEIKPLITKGKTLYFAHGFSVEYKDLTGVVPPEDVDVILVAPKGSGRTVRNLFLEGRGINASIAVHQDVSGKAEERATALAVGVGAGYIYRTSFYNEVTSDLMGERGSLMGAIQGLFQAQYAVLRRNGHSPSEAFNETVEEATQSLYPLIGKYGMDYMFEACSTTARRGALDWSVRFQKGVLRPYANRIEPVMTELYESVKSGEEAKRSLNFNNQPNYRELFKKETDAIAASEMWRAGKAVRQLRPEYQEESK